MRSSLLLFYALLCCLLVFYNIGKFTLVSSFIHAYTFSHQSKYNISRRLATLPRAQKIFLRQTKSRHLPSKGKCFEWICFHFRPSAALSVAENVKVLPVFLNGSSKNKKLLSVFMWACKRILKRHDKRMLSKIQKKIKVSIAEPKLPSVCVLCKLWSSSQSIHLHNYHFEHLCA